MWRPATAPAARPRSSACCAVDTTEAATEAALVEPEAAAGGATSADLAAADLAASRRYTSFLPPFFSRATTLEALGEGLWGLTQVCSSSLDRTVEKGKYKSKTNQPTDHHSPLIAV